MAILGTRAARRLVLTAAVLPAVFACEPAPTALDDLRGQLAVYSVLVTGSDSVAVYVVRYPPEPSPFQPGFTGVSGARVSISSALGATELVEQLDDMSACFTAGPDRGPNDTRGCYAGALPEGVLGSTEYALHVETPDGIVVTGNARTPEAIRIESPSDGAVQPFRLWSDSVTAFTLAWSGPDRLPRAEVAIFPDDPLCEVTIDEVQGAEVKSFYGDQLGGVGGILIVSDSTRRSLQVPISYAVCRHDGVLNHDSIPATITLAVYDENYAAYVSDVSGRERNGLDGGLGVFGAVTRDRIDVRFRGVQR